MHPRILLFPLHNQLVVYIILKSAASTSSLKKAEYLGGSKCQQRLARSDIKLIISYSAKRRLEKEMLDGRK